MDFKKGLYDLNKNANYNFQLNRLINWGGGDLEEVKKVSFEINSNQKWKETLIKLGDTAYKENRIENAIGYYRMSEFFMNEGDKDKRVYYKKAVNLFYKFNIKMFEDGIIEKYEVPYEDTTLPVMCSKCRDNKKGTILFHGGNDSYFEELFNPMLYLSKFGYDVYLFEGPGQGGVLREKNIKFTNEWELPVKEILDYFDLNDVIIIGVSLGGMLAPRAAAFESRIKYVVAWSLFPNFLSIALYDLPKILKIIFKFMIKHKMSVTINLIINNMIRNNTFMQWVFGHGMYAYDADTPYEYLRKLEDFQMINIGENINQDILILHGKEDHFINWKLYNSEIDSLVNAKSITFRLFTSDECASNHCQCGNTKLALDTIINWLDVIINK